MTWETQAKKMKFQRGNFGERNIGIGENAMDIAWYCNLMQFETQRWTYLDTESWDMSGRGIDAARILWIGPSIVSTYTESDQCQTNVQEELSDMC